MRISSRPIPDLDLVPIMVAAPGSYQSGPLTYSSIAAFVREDSARLHSSEMDLGLHWRQLDHLYRAAWIEDTGEVYVVQLGAPEDGGGHVELLASGLDLDQLDAALDGWREAHDRAQLDWLRDRLAGAQNGAFGRSAPGPGRPQRHLVQSRARAR